MSLRVSTVLALTVNAIIACWIRDEIFIQSIQMIVVIGIYIHLACEKRKDH